jgi:hypothetical protein
MVTRTAFTPLRLYAFTPRELVHALLPVPVRSRLTSVYGEPDDWGGGGSTTVVYTVVWRHSVD